MRSSDPPTTHHPARFARPRMMDSVVAWHPSLADESRSGSSRPALSRCRRSDAGQIRASPRQGRGRRRPRRRVRVRQRPAEPAARAFLVCQTPLPSLSPSAADGERVRKRIDVNTLKGVLLTPPRSHSCRPPDTPRFRRGPVCDSTRPSAGSLSSYLQTRGLVQFGFAGKATLTQVPTPGPDGPLRRPVRSSIPANPTS